MSHYKPYPKYKPSGLDWLDRVPEHWDVMRLRHIANFTNSNVDKKSYEGQRPVRLCNYIDVYNNEHITATLPFMDATASDVEIETFALKMGDVLITKDSEDPWDIGIPAIVTDDLEGVICGYHLTMIRTHDPNISAFVHRSLQSHPTKAYFFVESPGITRYGLSQDAIGDIKVCRPPGKEYVLIASWISRETSRINALISKKSRFIELLKEKRQALIRRAVTKGLDRNVTMKDSGIDWIGEIPEHWSVLPIKYIAKIGNGSTPRRDETRYWEGGHFPWLTSGCVNEECIDKADEFITDAALRECHLPIVAPPAVLIGITGQGKTRGMATTLRIRATVNQHLAFLCPDSDVVSVDFLRRVIDSAYEWLRDESDGVGGTKGAITCENLGDTRLAVPPVDEQQSIVKHLERVGKRLADLVEKTEASVRLLGERRSAVITAAVTGQIDLRGAP